MKNLFKRFLKALWRATGPLRRPVQRKLEAYMQGLAVQMINAYLPSVINRLQGAIGSTTYDTNLVLNSLVREVARLQMQVEILQQYAEDAHDARHALAVNQVEGPQFPPYDNEHAQVA